MADRPSTEEILAEETRFDGPDFDPIWDELGGMHYDKEGRQITLRQWAKLFDHCGYRRLGDTHIGDYWISTVWLGLDHGWGRSAPLIFETMVFKNDESDLDCRRYPTLAQAEEGHAEIVAEVTLFAELEL